METIKHDKENQKFILNKYDEDSRVEYVIRKGKMYLVHSEVPYHLRGKGIGKELVLKTFQKLTEEGYEAVAVCSYIKAVRDRNSYWSSIIE